MPGDKDSEGKRCPTCTVQAGALAFKGVCPTCGTNYDALRELWNSLPKSNEVGLTSFEARMQERLEVRIAELPTDPALLLGLLEQRHLLELSAWEACPEFVALKRAISARTAATIAEATELSDADRRAVTLFSSAPRSKSTSVERHLGNEVVKAAEELLGNLQATADIDPQRWTLMENLVEQIGWLKGFVHHGGFTCETTIPKGKP